MISKKGIQMNYLIKKILKEQVEKFPKLSMILRDYKIRAKINEQPKLTMEGFNFIGNELMQNGEFEKDETEIVKRILPNSCYANV